MRLLGEDAHGTWLYIPAGATARRGHEPERGVTYGCVFLVPRDAWWEAEFYWDHPRQLVYVNIGTPCEWSAGGIRQVDLDLDVIRTVDGHVQTLDEDEFAHHQVLYQYPPDLIAAARRAADEVALMLQQHTEPFGHAADRWIAQARDAG
jgi:protein associated with RNAse G/E